MKVSIYSWTPKAFTHFFNGNCLSSVRKDLNPVQTNMEFVAPRAEDVNREEFAPGEFGYHEALEIL